MDEKTLILKMRYKSMSNKNLQESILALSIDEVVDFLIKTLDHSDPEKFADCAVCGKDDWQLRNFPEEVTRPMLVAHPIPYSKNLACWYFPISCKNCGYTMFFDAKLFVEKFNLKEEAE